MKKTELLILTTGIIWLLIWAQYNLELNNTIIPKNTILLLLGPILYITRNKWYPKILTMKKERFLLLILLTGLLLHVTYPQTNKFPDQTMFEMMIAPLNVETFLQDYLTTGLNSNLDQIVTRTIRHPPLLLAIYKIILELTNQPELPTILSIILGIQIPILTYYIARELKLNEFTARNSAILTTLSITLLTYGHMAILDIPAAFLILTTILLALKNKTILTSLLLGITLIMKATALLILPLIGLLLLKNQKIKTIIAFSLTLIIPLLIWIAFDNQVITNYLLMPKTPLPFEQLPISYLLTRGLKELSFPLITALTLSLPYLRPKSLIKLNTFKIVIALAIIPAVLFIIITGWMQLRLIVFVIPLTYIITSHTINKNPQKDTIMTLLISLLITTLPFLLSTIAYAPPF